MPILLGGAKAFALGHEFKAGPFFSRGGFLSTPELNNVVEAFDNTPGAFSGTPELDNELDDNTG